MDLASRIGWTAGVEPEKVCEVVTLALEEFHRLTIVDEKGMMAAAMEACFAFGADAAFHLMGFLSSDHNYQGRTDEARVWNEVAMRFIPEAHRKGCERIAPWFSERSPARVRIDEAAEINKTGFFDSEDRFVLKLEFPSPSARAIALAIRRVARKYGDLDLAKAAKELHSRAVEATKNRQSVLSGSDDGPCPRQAEVAPQGDLFPDLTKSILDPMAVGYAADPLETKFAEEHRRFLSENRPDVLQKLRQCGQLTSYLSSVGQQAAEMYSDIMAKYRHSKEVQKLPHLEQVRALQSRQPEAEEIVRHDIIFQPLAED
jgi:hypothetical protein